jgi:hypothetical protein
MLQSVYWCEHRDGAKILALKLPVPCNIHIAYADNPNPLSSKRKPHFWTHICLTQNKVLEHGSGGDWRQRWLCRWGPVAFQPTDRPWNELSEWVRYNISQNCGTLDYGHEPRGTRSQGWLCCWGPAAVYQPSSQWVQNWVTPFQSRVWWSCGYELLGRSCQLAKTEAVRHGTYGICFVWRCYQAATLKTIREGLNRSRLYS